jgi:hypothetical protein
MAGSWPPQDFPNLSDSDYIPTSPATRRYNCVAWAAGDTSRKWWPDPRGIGYWPPSIPREATIEGFIRAFATVGYVPCPDGALESGYEKLALFAGDDDGGPVPTHLAVQLENGHWSSKLGDCEDIEHFKLEALGGPRYGDVVRFLKRRRT